MRAFLAIFVVAAGLCACSPSLSRRTRLAHPGLGAAPLRPRIVQASLPLPPAWVRTSTTTQDGLRSFLGHGEAPDREEAHRRAVKDLRRGVARHVGVHVETHFEAHETETSVNGEVEHTSELHRDASARALASLAVEPQREYWERVQLGGAEVFRYSVGATVPEALLAWARAAGHAGGRQSGLQIAVIPFTCERSDDATIIKDLPAPGSPGCSEVAAASTQALMRDLSRDAGITVIDLETVRALLIGAGELAVAPDQPPGTALRDAPDGAPVQSRDNGGWEEARAFGSRPRLDESAPESRRSDRSATSRAAVLRQGVEVDLVIVGMWQLVDGEHRARCGLTLGDRAPATITVNGSELFPLQEELAGAVKAWLARHRESFAEGRSE